MTIPTWLMPGGTLVLAVWTLVGATAEAVPLPLPDHPGNVFVTGENVLIPRPTEITRQPLPWRLLDERDRLLREGTLREGADRLSLHTLPIGWYRVEWIEPSGESSNWTSAAVLARLRAPTPADSPIAVDGAVSWFAQDRPADQRRFANLAALAGVSWIRDRLRWRDLEPEPGRFAEHTTYDSAASVQHAAGLRILQVFHDTPPWARDGRSGGEFAPDLRHVFRFARALALRFQGRVQAWEPWNEANVSTFGGHTVDQMCSWQKAAWLGFKAGDPNVLVGWNVTTTVPTVEQTDGIMENETWPYYDTYNIHSYDWAHGFAALWTPARAACAGRPLWVTECDRGQKHLGNAPWFDLSRRNERLKAEYLPQCYAQSLFAGARRHFHFVLGHYYEGNGVQFGLLRKDFTPRPAYAALAALGRLLAGAHCLGRWQPGNDAQIIAFRARPDGLEQDVLVAWAEREVDWPQRGQTRTPWPGSRALPVTAAFDYLGRELPAETPAALRSAPVYLLLPPGTAKQLPLQPPPALGKPRAGAACPIVLQALFPAKARIKVVDRPWSQAYAYRLAPGTRQFFRLRAYNFSDQPAAGVVELAADPPPGWTISPTRWEVEIAPGELAQLVTTIEARTVGGVPPATDGTCVWHGRFGPAGRAALAVRLKQP